jgi:hypothetical protein
MRGRGWLAGIALLAGALDPLAARGGETEIALPNGTFTPDPGTDAELREKLLDPAQVAEVEALVQFQESLSQADRKLRDSLGIELGPYVGGTAYLSRIPPGVDPGRIPGLRWAGLVQPRDKISRQLWSLVTRHVPPPPARLPVAVHFQGGTPRPQALAVIQKFATVAQSYGTLGTWAVEIDRGDVERLASEVRVRWVEDIPGGALPLGQP